MTFRYFDAHCHLQFDAFKDDREVLIRRMEEECMGAVVVGVDRATSEAALALAEAHPHVFASVGMHPHAETTEFFDSAVYDALAAHEKVVAIGECGLDYYGNEEVSVEQKEKQKVLFKDHILVAVRANKPLIIHARPKKGTVDAYQDALSILAEAKKEHGDRLRGDVHFFVGGIAEANAFRELGFTVSYTAVITFADEYDTVIRSVPLSQLLAETDAPYIAPLARRGKRNDPLAVIEVVRRIAVLRGESEESVRAALLAQTLALFSIQGSV